MLLLFSDIYHSENLEQPKYLIKYSCSIKYTSLGVLVKDCEEGYVLFYISPWDLTKTIKKNVKIMEKNLTLVNLKILVKIQPPTPPLSPKNCLPNNSDIWIIEDIENQHTLIQSSSKAWASQKGNIMVLK